MREFTVGPMTPASGWTGGWPKPSPFSRPLWPRNTSASSGSSSTARGPSGTPVWPRGDLLQLYINDEFFDTPTPENAFLSVFKPQLDILYEDENLLLVNKRPGLVVHPDEGERVNTLITHIQAYLYQKKEWNPRDEHSFAPALCNRIDRNTGGIVMAAKNAETLRVLNQKIRDREIAKYYLAVIHGRMSPPQGKLEGFLLKDEDKAQVKVYSRPVPGGKSAATLYKTLRTAGGLSLVECELLTGRTHQIRAQFAAAGHPLLGDGKYGRERDNRRYGRSFQALYFLQNTCRIRP